MFWFFSTWLSSYHLLRLAGGASGVAGLTVDVGVCRVRLRLGELSGVVIVMEPAE